MYYLEQGRKSKLSITHFAKGQGFLPFLLLRNEIILNLSKALCLKISKVNCYKYNVQKSKKLAIYYKVSKHFFGI